MFSSNNSIFIYSIILLHVATSAFGTLLGEWCQAEDPDIVRINELFDGPCKNILAEMIKKVSGDRILPPVKAVSRAHLKQEGKGKENYPGFVAIQDATQPNALKGIEGNFFPLTFDIMNLNGGDVGDTDRLKLAEDKAQYLKTSKTLQMAKHNAETTVIAAGVTQTAHPILPAVKENTLSGQLRKKTTSSSSNRSSSSARQTTIPLLDTRLRFYTPPLMTDRKVLPTKSKHK